VRKTWKGATHMTIGYQRPLYILAFDHRGSLQKKMFGIEGEPTPEQAAKIAEAKGVIYEGFERALADGAPRDRVGLLVDEQYGAVIAERAKTQGHVFAMPVEQSAQDEFDFEYGAAFGAHIERFDPTFAKALVRYNPEGDPDMNRRQSTRLQGLSDWLHESGRKFMFELLVPAVPEQLRAVGGDRERYDRGVRPRLMVDAIAELQSRGVEPDVWKIEGLESRADCERVAEQARVGGRDTVACVVLGRGADDAAVVRWLRTGAGVPGYVGFAIGRTIWWDEVNSFRKGSLGRDDAVRGIARRFRRYIQVYETAP
jgi:myo-inositol catabolism protein IolC